MKEHEEKKDNRRKRKEDGLEKKVRTKTARRKNRKENARVQKLGQFKPYVVIDCSYLLQRPRQANCHSVQHMPPNTVSVWLPVQCWEEGED